MSYTAPRSGRTILIIDDNLVVLETTRSSLVQAGFRVLTRDRASGAITAILHDRPDLVLLEVNMPNMNGDALAEILGRTRAARGTVVVLHSSLPFNVLRTKALAAGAQGFIQKTGVQAELVRQVRAFLPSSESLALRGAAPQLNEEVSHSSGHQRAALEIDSRISAEPPSSGSFPSSSVSFAASALPLGPPRAAMRPSSPPARRESSVPTALFLDDDLAVLTGYRRALSSEEMIGEYLTSAEQALRRISAARPPDVVITDLVMPGMNGIDLYRRALELDPTWRYRFVFITGAGTVGYVAAFLRRVEARALDKPVDVRSLRDAIRYAATGARIFRRHGAER